MAHISKSEARRQLMTGYIFAVIGFFIGLFAANQIKENPFMVVLGMTYAFWSVYWGIRIVSKPISNFFDLRGVHVHADNVGNLFTTNIFIKLTLYFIIFAIGYFIGALGGAIYKQVTLSFIAYT